MDHHRKANNHYSKHKYKHSSHNQQASTNENEGETRPVKVRRPPHLKGKEIGLYYAMLNKNKKKNETQLFPVGIRLNEEQSLMINHIIQEDESRNSNKPVTDRKHYTHIEDSHFKRDFLKTIKETRADKIAGNILHVTRNEELDEKYVKEQLGKLSNEKYQKMLKFRSRLPSFQMKNDILNLINNNQVTVISGETGCGKTTQVAQFILEDWMENGKGSICNVICSQPRRISAISVAERVAQERGESLGNSVGYQIRLEQVLPRPSAAITYCTTGIIVKKMEGDPSLSGVSHLILDEIHERDVLSDFIITLIKDVIKQRKDLKVILMSATLNSEEFSLYFNNAPHLNIPGFTFPVEEYYLEDVLKRTNFKYEQLSRKKLKKNKFEQNYLDILEPFLNDLKSQGYPESVIQQLRNPLSDDVNLDLIMALIKDICINESEGAILVFVTGFGQISSLMDMMQKSNDFPPNRYLIIPLHSMMASVDQKQIFNTPPSGIRKIIISTNIAETSITIDDVVYVIDCGKIKISNYEFDTKTATLKSEWVCLANAKQRKGRAGRVKSGKCFHLYTKGRELLIDQYQLPEILRERLENVILTAKLLQVGDVESFFKKLIDSPNPKAVQVSLDLLKKMNALDDDENLTPLGYHLAKLPISPQMGKMILFGAIFSCLNPILSIAATLDFKDPFLLPVGKMGEAQKKKIELSDNCQSDHLLFHRVLENYENCRDSRQFCWNYFLSPHTIKLLINMKNQFMGYLYDMNFVSTTDMYSPELNRNSDKISLVKAVVAAGLQPNVLKCPSMGKAPLRSIDTGRRNLFHPKSLLNNVKPFDYPFLVYYNKIKTMSEFVHDGTMVKTLPIIFFGDKIIESEENNWKILTVYDCLKFKCSSNVAMILQKLRNRFELFLEDKMSHPDPVDWEDYCHKAPIIPLMVKLISCEEIGDNDCFLLEV